MKLLIHSIPFTNLKGCTIEVYRISCDYLSTLGLKVIRISKRGHKGQWVKVSHDAGCMMMMVIMMIVYVVRGAQTRVRGTWAFGPRNSARYFGLIGHGDADGEYVHFPSQIRTLTLTMTMAMTIAGKVTLRERPKAIRDTTETRLPGWGTEWSVVCISESITCEFFYSWYCKP